MKKFIVLAIVLFTLSASGQWTTSSNNIYNSNTGNVGIGVTSPTAKLHIADAGFYPCLSVGIAGNMANTITQLIGSSAVIAANSSSVSTNGAVAWNFYNNGSSPSWAGVYMQHSGTAVTGNVFGASAGNQGTLVFQNVSNGIITSNGANIHISPAGTISATFLANGNVGIGTTTPGSFKLAVEGKIGAREVHVLTGSWPDYVFKKTYKLMPLNKLDDFIKLNNHLPDMPSESQVQKEGIDLGDMNAKLLQKIEELTLYVIELNKKVDLLERQKK